GTRRPAGACPHLSPGVRCRGRLRSPGARDVKLFPLLQPPCETRWQTDQLRLAHEESPPARRRRRAVRRVATRAARAFPGARPGSQVTRPATTRAVRVRPKVHPGFQAVRRPTTRAGRTVPKVYLGSRRYTTASPIR